MYTQASLMGFLKESSEEAHLESFTFDSPEQFRASLKCKVEDGQPLDYYNNFAKTWISKFSVFTSTAWIVSATHPRAKRFAFRKSYVCHRSSQNKSKNTIQNLRNVLCQAKVDFKTKFINKYTVRNDEHLLKGLNMTITIEFAHSHVVHSLEAFNLLKSSTQTDAIFYEYFENGHSATSAKCYHELVLLEKYGRGSAELTNANLNPNLRHIAYIRDRRWEQCAVSESAVMQNKTTALGRAGHTVRYNESPPFVVVLTAIMKRAMHSLPLEQVLLDETVLQSGVSVMFVFVPSDIGSLPIASVVFKEPNAPYSDMFFALKLAIECECDKAFQPNAVVLGNLKAKDAFIETFPETVVKKNRYTLCRELWEWMCNESNGVQRLSRHDVMMLFKKLIFAPSMADAVKMHDAYGAYIIPMNQCLNKLKEVWSQRNCWLVEDTCGDFDNAFPVVIRECVIRRCQSFNMCAMVDFLSNILEKQYKRIILCHVLGGDVKWAYTRLLPKEDVTASSFRKCNPNEYLLQQFGTARFDHLNLECVCCDCKVGVTGAFCEHLCGAVNCLDNQLIKAYALSNDVKDMFMKIVGEHAAMKGDFQSEFIQFGTGLQTSTDPLNDDEPAIDLELSVEVKQEVDTDPLKEEPMEEPMDVGILGMPQYEACMKALNIQFRRLNYLFSQNPNSHNMETMEIMTKELLKIQPATKVSGLTVKLNDT